MVFTKGRKMPSSSHQDSKSPCASTEKIKAHYLRRHYPAQVQRDFLSLLLSTTPASLAVQTGQAPLLPNQLASVYLRL